MRASSLVWMLAASLVLAWGHVAEGAEVSFRGELEIEYVDFDDDATEPTPHLGWDKFVLQPKVEVSDILNLDAQIYFNPGDAAYLNEFHSKFKLSDTLLLDVGKFERYIKDWHGRKTEEYPLLGSAFYRDDYWQLMLGHNLPSKKEDPKGFFAAVSVGNGLEIDDKQVSTDSSFKIIHDDSNKSAGPFEEWEGGFVAGIDTGLGMEGRLSVAGFYYVDRLSGDDRTHIDNGLDTLLNFTTDASEDKTTRAGVGAKWEPAKGTRIATMIASAKDADVERSAWFVEFSHKFDREMGEKLKAIEAIVSYGGLEVDSAVTKDFAFPGTWDRTKLIIGSHFHLADKTKIKAEYYVNGETTGGAEVDNNELVVQLEIKF